VMELGRLFHRRAAATRNALSLSPTVDRRVRQTSKDVDEAERSRRLASVFAGRRKVRHTGTLAPDHADILYSKTATLSSQKPSASEVG